MAVLGNNVDCGVSKQGTGIIDCIQALGKPVGFWDLGTGFSLNKNTDDFTRAEVINLIKAGTLHIFNDALDFAENNEDDVTQTFTSGIIADVRDGLPAFDFTFIKGYGWHAGAYTHNGFGGAVALLFENSVIGLALNSDGVTIEGLKRGRLKTQTFKNNTGSEVSSTMVSIQLTDTAQYNTRMFLVNEDSFGSSPLDVNGAINVNLEVVGAAPAIGDTTTTVSVGTSINSAVYAAGLVFGDFDFTGQTVTAATYDAASGTYELTHDALVAGTKNISLGAGVETAAQVGTTEVLYTGGTSSFTL